MGSFDDFLRDELRGLAEQGLARRLTPLSCGSLPRVRIDGREMLNFASNNYLGLATDPRVIAAGQAALAEWGAGAGASRLLSGDLGPHESLEADLAGFKGAEAARVFPSGWSACVGVLGALAGKDDEIFSDARNHASLIDGIRLTGARRAIYRHRDPEHLAELLAGPPPRGRRFVVTDGVFSMDGRVAPLAEIVDLAERHGAVVVVDDAHGTGVIGPEGRGSVEALGLGDRVAVRIGTLSKALGGQGGFVVGSRDLADLVIHRARSFVFSTGIAPAACAAAAAALAIARREEWRRETLRAHTRILDEGLRERGYDPAGGGDVPMLLVVLGAPAAAMALAARLREGGVLAPAIRPPTVPQGTSRIRLTPMATHSEDDVREALAAFPPAEEIEGAVR